MIGQPRRNTIPGTEPDLAPPARIAGVGEPACPKCRAALTPEGAWCSHCGFQAADPCWGCGKALPEGARFCPRCATPNTEPSVVACPQCRAVVQQGWGYCPACGTQARPVCESCDRPLRSEWTHCPQCGGEPAGGFQGTVPAGKPASRREEEALPFTRTGANPATAESFNARAVQAYERNDYAEAARLFQEAADADPTNASYWVNLGVAHGELGDDLRAFNAYRRAVDLNPREVQAYLNMGYLYAERERQAEAREMWERVVQLAPDSSEAQDARENLKSLEDL